MEFLQSVLGDDYAAFAERINAYNTANPDKAVKLGNLAGGAYVDVEKYNKVQHKNEELAASLEAAQKDGGANAQLRAELDKTQKELGIANGKVMGYERKAIASESKVAPEFLDYVVFEASKLVDEKTDFKTALGKFLDTNPKYKSTNVVKMRTSPVAKHTSDGKDDMNNIMNESIRSQFITRK